MIDVIHRVEAARRAVAGTELAEGGTARVVTVRQSYDATVEELWDACTNPERIPRWFLPVTGELRLGGRYQLENHAGGTITACEPPRSFEATWEFGESVSWIAVSLTSVGDGRSELALAHTVPVDDHWNQFGPGAVGVGWELGMVGMYLHLTSGGAQVDPEEVAAWTASDDGRSFVTRASTGWGEAHAASGLLTADEAAAQADRTTAAYTGS